MGDLTPPTSTASYAMWGAAYFFLLCPISSSCAGLAPSKSGSELILHRPPVYFLLLYILSFLNTFAVASNPPCCCSVTLTPVTNLLHFSLSLPFVCQFFSGWAKSLEIYVDIVSVLNHVSKYCVKEGGGSIPLWSSGTCFAV